VIVNAEAVDEEDGAAGSRDGDEQPGVKREAVERGLGLGRAVAYERGLDGPLEGAGWLPASWG